MRVEAWEVRPGLALHLDAERLVEANAEFTGPDRFRAHGPHYFICVGVEKDQSDWVATSSKPSRDRLPVRRKYGHEGWTRPQTYADPYQVWSLSYAQLLRGSLGVDHSVRGARNWAQLDFLYEVQHAA